MESANLGFFTGVGKILTLNGAVLNGSSEDVRRVFSELGEISITGVALVNAYRYRGLEMLKTLVECGAEFETYRLSNGAVPTLYINVGNYPFFPLVLLNNYDIKGCNRNVFLEGNEILKYFDNIGDDVISSPVKERCDPKIYSPHGETSKEEREKMFDYLFENRERAKIDFAELLFYAYFARDEIIVEKLKKHNITFSEKLRDLITGKFGRIIPDEWWGYCYMIRKLSNEDFLPVMSSIANEVGETLHITDKICAENTEKIFASDSLEFVLDNFDNAKINKTRMMKYAVDLDKPDQLELMVKRGWLKLAKKRDEMIQYAVDNNKTECTAYLLDFKNRTADLASERKRAEKKLERELNAAPDSVIVLKQMWSFKKNDDGTVIITGYKGNRTDVTVPEKIGNNIVTAIGDYAFSTQAPRVTGQLQQSRSAVEKIMLPDSITEIGKGAFYFCPSLVSIHIPDSVNKIGGNAFGYCEKLEAVKIPDSLTEIGEGEFEGCKALVSISVPDSVTKIGSLAFHLCESLETINIPASVTEIGEGAFISCTALKSIQIPNGVTEINNTVFYNCMSLVSINIPDSVTKIGNNAFYNCQEIVSMKIPEGVDEIGRFAFAYCSALKTLELPASLKSMKNGKIDGETQSIFYGDNGITVIVESKSYAESYCKRNGISYKYREDV